MYNYFVDKIECNTELKEQSLTPFRGSTESFLKFYSTLPTGFPMSHLRLHHCEHTGQSILSFWDITLNVLSTYIYTEGFFFFFDRGYCKIYSSTSWAETAQGKCKIIKGATFPEGCKSLSRQSATWVSRFFSYSTTCSIWNPGQSLTNTFMSADDIRNLGQTRPALYVSTVTSHNSQYTHRLEADLWRAKAKHGRGETIFPLHYTDFKLCHS